MAQTYFGDMVKAVVDVAREIVALDADLHADLEAVLLADGSSQLDLWGINLYPDAPPDAFIEYDSMINMRPSQGNRSRFVENSGDRSKIDAVIAKRITQ